MMFFVNLSTHQNFQSFLFGDDFYSIKTLHSTRCFTHWAFKETKTLTASNSILPGLSWPSPPKCFTVHTTRDARHSLLRCMLGIVVVKTLKLNNLWRRCRTYQGQFPIAFFLLIIFASEHTEMPGLMWTADLLSNDDVAPTYCTAYIILKLILLL